MLEASPAAILRSLNSRWQPSTVHLTLRLPACIWVQGKRRFDSVRALLAAAPASGQPRANFARNLVLGMEEAEDGDSSNVFVLARTLLTVSAMVLGSPCMRAT